MRPGLALLLASLGSACEEPRVPPPAPLPRLAGPPAPLAGRPPPRAPAPVPSEPGPPQALDAGAGAVNLQPPQAAPTEAPITTADLEVYRQYLAVFAPNLAAAHVNHTLWAVGRTPGALTKDPKQRDEVERILALDAEACLQAHLDPAKRKRLDALVLPLFRPDFYFPDPAHPESRGSFPPNPAQTHTLERLRREYGEAVVEATMARRSAFAALVDQRSRTIGDWPLP